MKHGKKYNEAAKQVDRATLYDPAEAQLSLTKQLNFISEQVVTDVMLKSRSVAQLFFLTEQVRQ